MLLLNFNDEYCESKKLKCAVGERSPVMRANHAPMQLHTLVKQHEQILKSQRWWVLPLSLW